MIFDVILIIIAIIAIAVLGVLKLVELMSIHISKKKIWKGKYR